MGLRMKEITFDSKGSKISEFEYSFGKMVKMNINLDEKGRDCIVGEGEIFGWKACRTVGGIFVYVRLRIPKEAKRVSPFDIQRLYKSRAEYAFVEQIIDESGKEYKQANSFVHAQTAISYVVGKIVRPSGYNPSPSEGCGEGINFHKYKDHCDAWK